MKVLINSTSGSIMINDTGVVLAPYQIYTIPPTDYLLWSASRDILSNIKEETIIVNDGEENLVNKRIAIALIQGNEVILSEYYTLVQDDSVLIGNGQILYLHDRFDTTDYESDRFEEDIVDDDPTWA